jgi:hypothetical protein
LTQDGLAEKALSLIRDGRWTEAIKAYRAATGADLASAERAVKELAARHGNASPEGSALAGLLVVAMFLGLIATLLVPSLFPGAARIVAPLVCEGRFEPVRTMHSSASSVRVNSMFYCTGRDGQRRVVSGKTRGAFFGAATLVFLLALGLWVRLRERRRPA